jgi:hypothetical protein
VGLAKKSFGQEMTMQGELVPDRDNRGSYWVEMIPRKWTLGREWTSRELAGPPPPAKEEGTPVRRYAGPLTRVVGLVSIAAADWDLQLGELRTFPKELADMLVAANHARLAADGE